MQQKKQHTVSYRDTKQYQLMQKTFNSYPTTKQ